MIIVAVIMNKKKASHSNLFRIAGLQFDIWAGLFAQVIVTYKPPHLSIGWKKHSIVFLFCPDFTKLEAYWPHDNKAKCCGVDPPFIAEQPEFIKREIDIWRVLLVWSGELIIRVGTKFEAFISHQRPAGPEHWWGLFWADFSVRPEAERGHDGCS